MTFFSALCHNADDALHFHLQTKWMNLGRRRAQLMEYVKFIRVTTNSVDNCYYCHSIFISVAFFLHGCSLFTRSPASSASRPITLHLHFSSFILLLSHAFHYVVRFTSMDVQQLTIKPEMHTSRPKWMFTVGKTRKTEVESASDGNAKRMAVSGWQRTKTHTHTARGE